MKQAIILFFAWSITAHLLAQTSIDSVYTYQKLNRSLNFAQLTFGGDALCITGGQSRLHDNNRNFGATVMPRVTIGGLHFWGHADFYVTFPMGIRFSQKPDFASRFRNMEDVETGMKIYPMALRPGRLSPYLGISFQPFRFGYQREGANYSKGYAHFERFMAPIQAGLTYTTKRYLWTAGLRYNRHQQFDYYESPTQKAAIRVNALNFNFGILRYIDTDKSMGTPRGVAQQNKMYHILKIKNGLSAWYWGLGPSAALQMSKSGFLKQNYPSLADEMLNSFLVPDLTFGRYFSKPDLNIGTTARTMGFKTGAFDSKLQLRRHTVGLEAYKFLLDYHGFVPFVGPMFSLEYLQLKTNGIKTASDWKPALGIVFGWDIRVTKTGIALLRTNLRYTPGLHLDVNGEKIMFNHLEFNFIQYVTFIGRKKLYQKR
jgi:hypothetical protein